MLKSKYEWLPPDIKALTSADSGLHPEIERLFLARGLDSFIDSQIAGASAPETWHSPFAFKDMQIVVNRIKRSIELGEKIMIYGDYDADGTTATAVLMRVLRRLNADVDFYIPNRFTDGYGPNATKFQQFADGGYKLVITVDCGISALNEATLLKDAGVDLIITDHHHAKENLPKAVAIIHPELDENYPFDKLAGVGVALKIAEALLDGELEDDDYILAMYGTVGDVVDLLDENRTIVKRGLKAIKTTELPGIQALLSIADENQYEMDEKTVGFAVCPRLNAPGRMEDANMVVDLLLANDDEMAYEIAVEIEYWNNQRKTVTNQITEAAISQITGKNLSQLKAVVLHNPEWHEGVLGIVASKIVDKFGIAVIVLTTNEEGDLKGSARAPEGFDILQALVKNEKLLKRYGGHESAAGMTLATTDPTELEVGLNTVLNDLTINRTMTFDLEMPLAELNLNWYNELLQLAPFGPGNQYPIIKLSGAKIKSVKRVGTKEHLKFSVYADKHELDAIFFNGAETFVYLTNEAKFDILAEVDINEWNGKKKLQLRIRDLACDELQLIDLRNQQLNTEFGTKITDAFIIDAPLESKQKVKLAYQQSGAKNIVLKPLNPMTMPTREQFVLVYKDVKKHAPFSLRSAHIEYFAKAGIPQTMLTFIIKVFVEMGLFTFNEGIVELRSTDQKVDFETAPSYISRKEKITVLEFLELATADEILHYLNGGCNEFEL